MKWEQYYRNYSEEAFRNGIDKEQVEKNLQYAKVLYDNNVPIIYDQYHLALLVGYEYEYLLAATNRPKRFYRKFEIAKRSSGTRIIHEPLPSLKEIQYWVLEEILLNRKESTYAKAYIKGKSIKDNARFHRNQKQVLNMDIENFFGTITFKMVLNVFMEIGYNKPVAMMLAKLCYLESRLPQGAPTSPKLSNLIMLRFDKKASDYAKENQLRYTRYADDITFSGEFNCTKVIRDITWIIEKEGFKVNLKKTRVQHESERQQVTGIVTNKIMQVSKSTRKQLRQDMYYIKKYGLNSHLEHKNENRVYYLNHLLGIANYIVFINPKDTEVREYVNILTKMIKSM